MRRFCFIFFLFFGEMLYAEVDQVTIVNRVGADQVGIANDKVEISTGSFFQVIASGTVQASSFSFINGTGLLDTSGSTQTKTGGLGLGTSAPSSKFEIVGGSLTIRGIGGGLVVATGSVGIGTQAPEKKLHIEDSSTNIHKVYIRNTDAASNNDTGILFDSRRSDGSMLNGYADIVSGFSTTKSNNASLMDFRVRTNGGGNVASFFIRGQESDVAFIGIGTAAPAGLLHVKGADNTTAAIVQIAAVQASVTTLDTFIDFRSLTGSEGTIAGTGSAGVIAYNTFTGSHYSLIEDRAGLDIFTLVEATGEKIEDFPMKFEEKEVITTETKPKTDKEGNLVLDEEGNQMMVTETSTRIDRREYKASPKGQVVKSRICKTRQSQAAWGFWGGQDKEGRDMIFCIGTGFAWVVNAGGDVEIGDYLMSTDVAGAVERQVDILGKGDGIKRNYTVAKSLERIVWGVGETKRKIAVTYQGG